MGKKGLPMGAPKQHRFLASQDPIKVFNFQKTYLSMGLQCTPNISSGWINFSPTRKPMHIFSKRSQERFGWDA